MGFITSNLVTIMLIIGIAAFIVSVITQVTKNIGFLAKIPTDLQVIVLSIIVCLTGYFAYASYLKTEIIWYYIAGAIMGAFIVAFVTMYGWVKLTELFKRFVNKEGA